MSTRPSWSVAPKWAKWLACDEDGNWYWFEARPSTFPDGSPLWVAQPGTRFEYAYLTWPEAGPTTWTKTLEPRPKP